MGNINKDFSSFSPISFYWRDSGGLSLGWVKCLVGGGACMHMLQEKLVSCCMCTILSDIRSRFVELKQGVASENAVDLQCLVTAKSIGTSWLPWVPGLQDSSSRIPEKMLLGVSR